MPALPMNLPRYPAMKPTIKRTLKRDIQNALAATAVVALASMVPGLVLAQDTSSTGVSGVVQRVGDALERGAQAAARGIERGAKAAEHGIRVGVQATARGIERGAQATAKAAATVAKKLDLPPAPPAPAAPPAPPKDEAASRT